MVADTPPWGGGLVKPPAFAEVRSLGEASAVYTRDRGVATGVIGAVVAIFFLALAMAPLSAGAWVGVAILTLVASLPGGAAVAFFYGRARSAAAVVMYERGFAAQVSGRVVEMPYDDIVSIRSDEAVARGSRSIALVRRYQITDRRGRCVRVDGASLGDAEKIADQVKHRTNERLLSEARPRYDAGEPVDFGKATVSRQALRLGGRSFPWSEVAGVTLKDGRLGVALRGGGHASLAVRDVDNADVLAALIGAR